MAKKERYLVFASHCGYGWVKDRLALLIDLVLFVCLERVTVNIGTHESQLR